MRTVILALIHLHVGDCTQSLNTKDTTYRKIANIDFLNGQLLYIYQMANTPADVKHNLYNQQPVKVFEEENKQVICPEWFQ